MGSAARTEQDWLATRICDLGLTLAGSDFAPGLAIVAAELQRAGIALRPQFYLSTGYGCVERTTWVGVLFTDGSRPLRRLARAVGMRVRGPAQVLWTLRHEAGHAFCYGHRLYAQREFRVLFGVQGSFFRSYPDRWSPSAADRSRVARGDLIELYAARHADEDFSVCFQTWLADPAGCFARYRRRPRIVTKLEYVAEAVARCGATPVPVRGGVPADRTDALRLTLGQWFERVRRTQDYNLFPKGPVA